MKLRSSQQANIPLDSTSHLNKLNELISVIEARRIKYDSEKKNLKGKLFLAHKHFYYIYLFHLHLYSFKRYGK
jgi:hypothetical protein